MNKNQRRSGEFIRDLRAHVRVHVCKSDRINPFLFFSF